MSITLIPFFIPLLWSLLIAAYWRIKMKEPINHWIVCALVFSVNFFWFAYSCVLFLTFAVIHFLKKNEEKKETKKEDESTK